MNPLAILALVAAAAALTAAAIDRRDPAYCVALLIAAALALFLAVTS